MIIMIQFTSMVGTEIFITASASNFVTFITNNNIFILKRSEILS